MYVHECQSSLNGKTSFEFSHNHETPLQVKLRAENEEKKKLFSMKWNEKKTVCPSNSQITLQASYNCKNK